jgi:signal recognition particle subunit SRP54
MFDTLSEKLQRIFKNLKGEGRITEEHLDVTLKEIRIALLEADVNFKVVKQFTDAVKQKSLGQEVMQSLSPGQQIVKIVHDELIEILGGENVRLNFASQPPTVIMMVGLQGSGKTTTSGKLPLHLKNRGRRPLLVPCDVYRPAAIDQLRVVANNVKLPFYEIGENRDPIRIAQDATGEIGIALVPGVDGRERGVEPLLRVVEFAPGRRVGQRITFQRQGRTGHR